MPHLCDDLQFGFEETGRHGGTRLLSRPPIDDLHRQRVGLLLVGGGAHFGERALAELAADGVAESVQDVVHIAQVFLPVGSTRRGPSAAPSSHADDGFPPRSSVSSAAGLLWRSRGLDVSRASTTERGRLCLSPASSHFCVTSSLPVQWRLVLRHLSPNGVHAELVVYVWYVQEDQQTPAEAESDCSA